MACISTGREGKGMGAIPFLAVHHLRGARCYSAFYPGMHLYTKPQ